MLRIMKVQVELKVNLVFGYKDNTVDTIDKHILDCTTKGGISKVDTLCRRALERSVSLPV